jgi:hypothetical protein
VHDPAGLDTAKHKLSVKKVYEKYGAILAVKGKSTRDSKSIFCEKINPLW